MGKIYVNKIGIEGKRLFAETEGGSLATYDLTTFKGFRNATGAQIVDFKVVDRKNIYWPLLDECINLEGMLHDNHLCELTPAEDSVEFRSIPELHDYAAEDSIALPSEPSC